MERLALESSLRLAVDRGEFVLHYQEKHDLRSGEITEGLLLRNFDQALETLSKIKELGVRIGIDNFGTSYTSLSTLDKFHFDTLKIDGSVIRDIANEPSDKQLTEAIISVGRTIAMTIVAEGVETQEQAEFLLASSCDQVQGFYYDKPTPPF